MLPINKWVLYLSFCCFFLPLIFSKTKQIRLDGKIGELSYSIYICHMLIWYVISPYVKTGDLSHYKGEILVITSVLFAFILVKYISEPLEIYRRKRLTAYRARKHED
jgi:peptidoglycan/LPS O-acetylase OafA/YrhL